MVLRAVNGHLLNVGGHLVANDDCCCETNCSECSSLSCCTGNGPQYVKMVASGISNCAGETICSTLNGTFILVCFHASSEEGFKDSTNKHRYIWPDYDCADAWLNINNTSYRCFSAAVTQCQCEVSADNLDDCGYSHGTGGTVSVTPCDSYGNSCVCGDYL